MSLFGKLNSLYQEFFGSHLPPSRSCVGLGSSGNRVMLDVLAQRHSGQAMRAPNSSSELRSVLHVQGLSYWAPVCVGPYSQANSLRQSLVYLAGQIGLDPHSMTLVKGQHKNANCGGNSSGWKDELRACWKNMASVLDALQTSELEQCCLGVLVYVQTSVVEEGGEDSVRIIVEDICRSALEQNAGVVRGMIDGLSSMAITHLDRTQPADSAAEDENGGYEDFETWMELEPENATAFLNGTNISAVGNDEPTRAISSGRINNIPILFVSIPEMPVGASCELEMTCISKRAHTTLGDVQTKVMESNTVDCASTADETSFTTVDWDCGYEYDYTCWKQMQQQEVDRTSPSLVPPTNQVTIDASVCHVHKGCAAMAWINATHTTNNNTHIQTINNNQPSLVESQTQLATLHFEPIISAMVDKIAACVKTAGLTIYHLLHVRLYYNSTLTQHQSQPVDAKRIRCILNEELVRVMYTHSRTANAVKQPKLQRCASSVVPVQGFVGQPYTTDNRKSSGSTHSSTLLAMQVTMNDLVHMETEMWIHEKRDNYSSV